MRGRRREFLDVDQWGRKKTGGVSLRWVDTISRDLSWIQLEDWTDEHGEVSLISYVGQIREE